MKVLWLAEEDVTSLLNMDDAIAAVEKAFADHGRCLTQMPPKSYLYFSKYDGDLRAMPAYLEGLEAAGVKIVNVHARNPEIGLPTVMALLVLNSPKTGAPVSIMGATYLTSMRTGAAGAVAAKHLARPKSRVVGLVGAGVQARTQLLGLSKIFEIERVIVSDRSIDNAKSFVKYASKFLDCDYHLTTDAKDACDCDILVTATPARRPVVKESWVKAGTHINAIGADAQGKQELQSSLTRKAKIVVDDIAQAAHSGEVNVPISEGALKPDDIFAQIGEIIVGKKPGRTCEEEITIFDSTGLGIQDVAVGSVVYEKALSSGMGVWLKLA
ncbi:MAG: Alanine dehydrogenase [Methanosaeta sp. PtaB.Bin018]|nr:MAG: Alanine dehydrogenase [Methanosaeta sp. PtaB.Bin018]OPY46546.1 MAG: Alanine dehydrogenase [Methanosaeta sp. PtaU1.Bin016]